MDSEASSINDSAQRTLVAGFCFAGAETKTLIGVPVGAELRQCWVESVLGTETVSRLPVWWVVFKEPVDMRFRPEITAKTEEVLKILMSEEQDKKKEIKKELTEDELKRSSGGLRDAENGMPKGVIGPGIKPDFPFR